MNRDDLKKIKKQYVLFVNRPELVDKALELGYEYVEYEPQKLPKNTKELLKEFQKNAVRINLINNRYTMEFGFLGDSSFGEFELYEISAEDGNESDSFERAIKEFPSVEEIEELLIEEGIIMDTDYTNRCGNCHSIMEENDKYCRYCGTLKGEGAFAPYKNEMYCIYAPPMKTRHKCVKCGYKWIVDSLGFDQAKFCPKCGGSLESDFEEDF